AARTTANAMRYLCGAPSVVAASGSTSGSSSLSGSGSTALATDIGGHPMQTATHVDNSGILLGGIDARLPCCNGIGNVESLLDRFRTRNRRTSDDAVLLALGSYRRVLSCLVCAAAGEKKRENAAGYGDSAN